MNTAKDRNFLPDMHESKPPVKLRPSPDRKEQMDLQNLIEKGDSGLTPLKLLILTSSSIFIGEALIMFIITLLPALRTSAEVFLDAFLLSLLLFPVLYLLLYRPMRRETMALKIAIEEIKTLHGIVPICSHCKKIRDSEGYWQQVEVYVRDHTEAEFSHSLCDGCLEELYPEEAAELLSDGKDNKAECAS